MAGVSILVVGSINMDLVVRCPHMPGPGETVLGSDFFTSPGGKGANQAVAATRLGAHCRLIGRVGDDDFGQTLRANLEKEQVDCRSVYLTEGASSGVAMIVIDSRGENSIVVASGANYRVTPDDVFCEDEAFSQASVVVLQLELPLPTVRAAIEQARRHGCRVVLDPAPAPRAMADELFNVDVISPNVSEAEILLDAKPTVDRIDKVVAADLLNRGAKVAVLKLGRRGAMLATADGQFHRIGPYRVPVVDTTAAGDAFTGALAVALARGDKLGDTVKFANAAGALACTRMGAQQAMPTLDEVMLLMTDQPQ